MKEIFGPFARSPRFPGGFTLVELMVVVGLITIVSAMVFQLLSNLRKSAEPDVSNRLLLQMEARKGADVLTAHLRECSEVVRPLIGETIPYLVVKDLVNNICVMYLDNDEKNSKVLKKNVYKLVLYTNDHTGGYKKNNEKVLVEAVKQLTFTCVSPFSVMINLTLASEKGEFQFLSHLGLMNLGDVE